MGTSTGYIMTISNSIIGVSVLAMPFCFKQCGIVLSCLLLILSNILSRSTCHFLLKSAIISRRRNYELLAFHVFGAMGKTFVELSIIGFMMGTCIAFFVVMGDLGPAILSNVFTHIRIETLRPTVLMGLAVFIVLPLGLLRNVESLSTVSAATILFYLCLVLKMIAESSTQLIQGDWLYQVKYWNPGGLLQCLPIFSMALFCQTQLFDIFESMPNLSLDRMNMYIGSAVNMCTAVYMSVGFFGYVAYYKLANLSGNVLLSFTANPSSEIIKFGFVLSVAVSFPLVIFPCRASIYSFLFRKGHTTHYEAMSHAAMSGGSHHIPESRFRCITLFIIFVSLLTAMMSSNIELVLGLVGATIGVLICVLLPTYIFVRVSGGKPTTERLYAKVLFTAGICIMVLGTYANLSATENSEPPVTSVPSMFIVQDNKQGGEIMKLAETIRINNNFMLQEIDSKIEKPNLDSKAEVNQMRMEYDKKLSNEKIEKKKGNDEKIVGAAPEVVKDTVKDFAGKINDVMNTTKNDKELINNEAINKEEKEAQNENSPAPKVVNEEKNRELEILEKLKKQGEEQEKIIKQQEIILKEVIKQNKQLEEIKQKEESKVEMGDARLSSVNDRVSNDGGNVNGKVEFQQNGIGLVSHLNQGKSVSNNLISEKILELNENIKELNRDELKLTNQIDKVKENIQMENKLDEVLNKQNGIASDGNSENVVNVNQNVGEVIGNMPINSLQVVGNDGYVNRQEQQIQQEQPQQQQPVYSSPNGVQSPIGGINPNVPNVNVIPVQGNINAAVPNVVSKEPLASNGEINNIELPPNRVSLSPPTNNIHADNNILNEAYIEVQKEMKKDPDVHSVVNPAVPIALMLQPSEPKDAAKPKTIDIVKTRDILEEHRRDKRDVRVEPVNPVPPEYETANRGNNAIDGEIIKDAVALIEKNNAVHSNVENTIDGEIIKEAVASIEKNNDLQTKTDNEIDRKVKGTIDHLVNDPFDSGNGILPHNATDGSVIKEAVELIEKTDGLDRLNDKIDTQKNKEVVISDLNDSLRNDVKQMEEKLNIDTHDEVKLQNAHNAQETKLNTDIHEVKVQNAQETKLSMKEAAVDIVNSIEDSNRSNKTNVEHKTKIIPNDNVNKSEMQDGNKIIPNDKLVKTNPNVISLNNKETVDMDANSVANESTKDKTIAGEVSNVSGNTNSTSNGANKTISNIDRTHIGEDSNVHVGEVGTNQNEQCEVSADSKQDIRVPQLLSNLNPADLMKDLKLENQFKPLDHVMNMAADKK